MHQLSPHLSSEQTPSALTPPPSHVASLSNPEYAENDPSTPTPAKGPRMSVSSFKSKSESALRGMIPRRGHTAQNKTNVGSAPLDSPEVRISADIEKPLTPTTSHLSPDIAQIADDGPDIRPKSKSKGKTNKQKPHVPEVTALEGEDIASRLKFRTASIDGEFQKIEYGQFKGRPACLITVDVRLVYQPENTIKKVKIDFQFGPLEELNEKALPTVRSPISKVLAPVELEGMADRSKDTQHTRWEPEIAGLSFKGKVGGGGANKTINSKHRWRVQGQTEEHDDVYDTFRWRMMENTVSEDSVPRHVRLGMIAFHKHERFWVETTIEGDLRGSIRGKGGLPSKSVKEKRWFDPPTAEQVGEHVLHEGMLQTHVGNHNLQIVDVEPDRKLERQLNTLIDITAMNGNDQDGGGMIMGTAEQDLMSTFTNDEELGADSCNGTDSYN